MSIDKALIKLGYSEFVVRGDSYDGIEWVVQPETVPSEEEVLDMVNQLEVLEQQEFDAKVAAKESAIAKLAVLGLSEDEIKALVGA